LEQPAASAAIAISMTVIWLFMDFMRQYSYLE
jgi:hypothetical protein